MGVTVGMWRLSLISLLLTAAQAQSDRARLRLCERCEVERFHERHEDQCRSQCPGISSHSQPVWPPSGAEVDRKETVETSTWPSWPPSPTQDCRRCSRQRYRSANEEQCKNCPEQKVTKEKKIQTKRRRKLRVIRRRRGKKEEIKIGQITRRIRGPG